MAKANRTSGPHSSTTLRQRAEKLARMSPTDIAGLTSIEVQKLIYELQIHQIELELQNEELRHAQVELAHSRDRYSDLYEFAPTGYVTLDADGKIQNANLTTAAMLGVERQNLLRAKFSSFVNRESQDEFYLHRQAVLASETKQSCDVQMNRADGRELTARLESIAFGPENDRRCRTALIDVTHQKVAEETLRLLNSDLGKSLADRTGELQQYVRQVRLLTEAVSHLGEGVLITSEGQDWPGRYIIFVNDTMCQITGYPAAELTSQSPRVLLGDDSNRETLDRINAELSAGRSVLAELTNFRKDGTRYDGELFITPMFNADGRRTHFVSIHRDITQRKRAEQQLRKSTEQLRAVLNTAADAIITINHRGIINDVNAATERLFGYKQEELIGRNVSILMPQPYRDEHDEYIRRYLETGKARIIGIGRDVLGQRKDGSTFPVGLAVSEVDHLGLFTGIIRDMSDQRKLQRDVVSIADEEQRRIGQDLHDSTQQELVGLGMLTQTLLSILTQESRDRPTAAIEKSCELIKKILNGLSRAQQEVQSISRGLVPISLEPAGLMVALRELARRTDEVRGVSCAFKCEQPVEVAKSFIATHLYRIAQEAITNALKHARPEHILIALESDNVQVTLRVADDGTGFDPDEQSEGMGLKTMQYRAILIGANLAIRHIDTGGTLVTCNVFNRWG